MSDKDTGLAFFDDCIEKVRNVVELLNNILLSTLCHFPVLVENVRNFCKKCSKGLEFLVVIADSFSFLHLLAWS